MFAPVGVFVGHLRPFVDPATWCVGPHAGDGGSDPLDVVKRDAEFRELVRPIFKQCRGVDLVGVHDSSTPDLGEVIGDGCRVVEGGGGADVAVRPYYHTPTVFESESL